MKIELPKLSKTLARATPTRRKGSPRQGGRAVESTLFREARRRLEVQGVAEGTEWEFLTNICVCKEKQKKFIN